VAVIDEPRADFAGRTVLVTGAAGFIGGRLTERLAKDYGAKIRCLVRDGGRAERLAMLPVEIIEADLASAVDIDKAVDGARYVFHCAYDHRSRAQNIDGTQNLIDASLTHKVERFVYVSTVSVYEPLPDGPLTELTRDGDRTWAYTRNKLDLEQLVLSAATQRGLPGTVVQPTIVYGPFSKPWTNAPAEMLLWGEVILPGKGEGLCNAVYIDDLIDGLLLAATKPEAVGERFLMSGPEPVTWGQFFNSFATALGTASPTFWPAEKIAKARGGLLNKPKMVAAHPRRLVGFVMHWSPARRLVEAGLDALPRKLRNLASRQSRAARERKLGEVFVPGRQALALYSAKASVDSAKARKLLGYAPKFDLTAGMIPTREYLERTYGELRARVCAQRKGVLDAKVTPQVDLANAD